MRKKITMNKTKRLFLFFIMLFNTFILNAQVTVGALDVPQKFSDLEIYSNDTGGLRLPHLTTSQRDSLSNSSEFKGENHRGNSSASISPGLALGLTIYNTDNNCTEYWNGYKWTSLCIGTANIVLNSTCGNYDLQNIPVAAADGTASDCEYIANEEPKCVVNSGNAYDIYLTAGANYAMLIVDEITSSFKIEFQPNNSSLRRNAIVRVVNNCTGEFKDFLFAQEGATCLGVADSILNESNLSLCQSGSSFAYITNEQSGIDYIWVLGGMVVHTGSWYEITRAGTYYIYASILDCGISAKLIVNETSDVAPSRTSVSASNGGVLCNGGNVVLTANTKKEILWFHNGRALTTSNKNKNPITLSGSESKGKWFAAVLDGNYFSYSSNTIDLIDNTLTSSALPMPVAKVNDQLITSSGLVICKNGTLKLEIENVNDYMVGTEFEWFINGVSINKSTSFIQYYTMSG